MLNSRTELLVLALFLCGVAAITCGLAQLFGFLAALFFAGFMFWGSALWLVGYEKRKGARL